MNNYIRIPATDIRTFISNVFERLGVSSPDAAIASDVLVQADLRGVDSHGMNNLFQYIDPLRSGELNPQPIVKAITETPTTVLLDGDGGMGLVVGVKAMELCIGKAYQCGVGIATVRRSRHFGMASLPLHAWFKTQYDWLCTYQQLVTRNSANVRQAPQ